MYIERTDDGKGGHFKAVENEVEAGRMVYTWAGEDKFIIEHTDVSPDFRGKGVGNKLLMEVVQFARRNNVKIIPLCPFAKSVFDKTEDIRDVLN